MNRTASLRYRLHADLPVAFSCYGAMWRFEQHVVVASGTVRCEAVGPRHYTVASAADELSLLGQLRHGGVEVRLNSYLCTLFLRLEQLGLAERVVDVQLRRAS